ncbi:hypothetical protein GYB57_14000 [bacterium]|nr:hypothetical protein [bacterium]
MKFSEQPTIYTTDNRILVKDLTFAKIYYFADLDLLEVEYQANFLVDRNEALLVMEHSRQFRNGSNKYTMITATQDYFNMTPEARSTFAAEMKTGFKLQKMAILVNSLAYRIMANFFIRFDKPPVPTKLFNSRKEAIDWLLKN